MDPTEEPGGAELRDELDRVAAAVDVPDTGATRRQVHRRAGQRTARTRIAAGFVAVAGLALGGVVVTTAGVDDGSPTRIAEEPVVESTVDEQPAGPGGTDVSTSATVAADTGVPATDVPATDGVPPGERGTADDPAAVAGMLSTELLDVEPVVHRGDDVAGSGDIVWVVPWHDGFLASVRPQQPLPEAFPEEISERFPQEVRDLFGGELPPTIAEATEMLQEAGLLDEVMDIVAGNQEVSDAVYGAPMPDPEVRFSTDGTDWQPIEFALPDGFQPTAQAASTGDRLALLGIPSEARRDVRQPVLLASTTDLGSWDVVEVDPAEPPLAVPDTFDYRVWASSLAVSDDRWIVSVEASLEPRLEAFLDDVPPVGMSSSADGFTVMADDGTAVTVTWEETGASPELLALLEDAGSYYASVLHTGTWDGVMTSTPVEPGWGAATVNADGFYVVSAGEVLHSPDGTSWTSLPIPGSAWPEGLFTVDGAVVLGMMEQDPSGPTLAELYLLEGPGGPWLRADLALPPAQFAVGRGVAPDGALALEQWPGQLMATPVPDTDPVTTDPMSTAAPPLEVPPTEESAIDEMYVDAPVTWVLASADGEHWLLDELPSSVDDVGHPRPIARNGSTVVVHGDGAWFSYELP